MISIVIPLYNELENIAPLYDRLCAELPALGREYEVLLVNDGSTDGSDTALRALAERDDRIKVIAFRRNFGQTAAMMAGIDHAKGEVIIPMDGDLQNDPCDIGALLAKLDEGYDVVSGWRKDRHDNLFSRDLPSRAANRLISWVSGIRLHDYGCSLKAYRASVIKDVKLYGEMHRFIPIYTSWRGARITEIPVSHHARKHGQSKYGLERIYKVLFDLLLVKFMGGYATKPMYVFGGVAVFCFLAALLAFGGCAYDAWVLQTPILQNNLFLVSAMTFLGGIFALLLGFLAELLTRIHFESQGKSAYQIRDTLNL